MAVLITFCLCIRYMSINHYNCTLECTNIHRSVRPTDGRVKHRGDSEIVGLMTLQRVITD